MGGPAYELGGVGQCCGDLGLRAAMLEVLRTRSGWTGSSSPVPPARFLQPGSSVAVEVSPGATGAAVEPAVARSPLGDREAEVRSAPVGTR